MAAATKRQQGRAALLSYRVVVPGCRNDWQAAGQTVTPRLGTNSG